MRPSNLFIITRFNLRINDPGWERDRKNKPVLTSDWLKSRFSLFEQYCFPSVRAQTDQAFIWLVYFSHDTTKEFRLKISTLTEKSLFFKPIFVVDHDQFFNQLVSDIECFLTPKCDRVITCRLDNDDVIHRDYVKQVKTFFNTNPSFGFLNFKKGYCFRLNKNLLLTQRNTQIGPFLSKIDQYPFSSDYKTVIQFEHQNVASQHHTAQFEEEGMWIQLIHNDNMNNRLMGRPLKSIPNASAFQEPFRSYTATSNTLFPAIASYFLYRKWIVGLVRFVKFGPIMHYYRKLKSMRSNSV